MEFTKRKRYVSAGLIVVICTFLFFQFFYAYHLFFKEQMQLFLFSSDYFYSYSQKPAWLACYLGDFFTQFFYFRGGGPLIIAVFLGSEYFISAKVIERITKNQQSWLWGIVPVAIDWSMYLNLSYNLSSSIGFILMQLLFLLYLNYFNWKTLSFIPAILISFAGYWMAGSSIFILPILIILNPIKNKQESTTKWKILLLGIWLIPYFFTTIYLLPIKELYIFPGTKMQSILLPTGFALSIIIATIFNELIKISVLFERIIVLAIFTFLVITGFKQNANFNFEKILSLDSETYFGRPEKVIELARKYQIKNKYATYFTNIALANQKLLPEQLLDYYQPGAMGLILPVAPTETRESIVFSNEVFFLLGDMNLAQHSAMLGNTFSPFQRSSRMIKRLAEINLIIGDSVAANKYLRILNKTLFHKEWALAHEKMNRPTLKNEWLNQKRELLPKNDIIRKPNDYMGALRYLAEEKPENKTAIDYLLCSLLLNKNLKEFKTNYDKYLKPKNKPVPKVYSEALLIVLYLQKATKEEMLEYKILPQEINDFIEYTRAFNKSEGALEPLEKKFEKSYWYYYHFAKLVTN